MRRLREHGEAKRKRRGVLDVRVSAANGLNELLCFISLLDLATLQRALPLAAVRRPSIQAGLWNTEQQSIRGLLLGATRQVDLFALSSCSAV